MNYLNLLQGKRTHLVAAAAIVYLIVCQFTKTKADVEILGIFGALGLSALRSGIKSESRSEDK